MAEYIDKKPFLDKLLYMGYFDDNDEIKEVADSFTVADVVERSKIDKAIDELRKEIEENHLNVIEYAEGEWITKDFIYGAIERLKRNIGE